MSLLIVTQNKTHSISETLVKPRAQLVLVRNVLGEESERKIKAIVLSDNTVQRKIDFMANDRL